VAAGEKSNHPKSRMAHLRTIVLHEPSRRLYVEYFGFYLPINLIFSHRHFVQISASPCKGRWLKFPLPHTPTEIDLMATPRRYFKKSIDRSRHSHHPSCPKESLTGFAH
jgi:hypothetical protein